MTPAPTCRLRLHPDQARTVGSVNAPMGGSQVTRRYNLNDEVDCAWRELQRRRDRYPALIQADKLSPERAEREIDLMQAIYSRLSVLAARKEQGELFGEFDGGVRICGPHQRRRSRRARSWPYRD